MGADVSGATEEQTTCSYDEKQHEECKKSVANYEQMITDYNALIDKSKKDEEVLNFKIAELEAELNNSNTISKESEEKIKDLEKQLKEHENDNKKIKDLEAKITKAETNYKTMENNYKNTQKKLTTAETNYKNTQKKLTDTETNYKNTQKKLTTAETNYKTAQNNYNKLNDRINRLKKTCTAGNALKCNAGNVYKILNEKFTPNGSSCGTIMYCIIALVLGILIGAWLFGSNNRYVYRETLRAEPINDIEYNPDQ